jgi:hypothetical protein
VQVRCKTHNPLSTPSSNWKLHSTGVDWISVTATAPAARVRLQRATDAVMREEEDAGNTPLPARLRDYVGSRCGQAFGGDRRDSYYSQLSGYAASRNWRAVMVGAHSVTRIDVQVTALSPLPEWDEAKHAWETLESEHTEHPQRGWRSYIQTRPMGATLYLGAPTSARRLRLYDKHAQDPYVYPPGAWRYEVQARHGLARSIATSLGSGDHGRFAGIAHVYESFRSRGIHPRFRASGVGVLGHVPRTRSDDARSLRWIDEQVRPTIGRLVRAGYGPTLTALLGLGADGE